MKSRKTVLLMVLVIAVWGTIGYKIIMGLTSEDDMPVMPLKKQIVTVSDSKDDYPLRLSYKDPFLKNSANRQTNILHARKPNLAIPEPALTAPTIIIHWEKIQYMGSIYNTTKKSTVALLRIDSIDFMGRQGELVSDFVIENITKDSVQLSFGNQLRYIIKKK